MGISCWGSDVGDQFSGISCSGISCRAARISALLFAPKIELEQTAAVTKA